MFRFITKQASICYNAPGNNFSYKTENCIRDLWYNARHYRAPSYLEFIKDKKKAPSPSLQTNL